MPEERLIAIAAEDTRGFEGQVSAHFGHCPFYVLAEVDGIRATVSRVVPNPHSGAHQPGVMPRFIRDLGADVIIAGGMGPRAIEMFHDFGIAVATGAVGTVEGALGAYLRGESRGEAPCAGSHQHDCGNHERQTGEVAMSRVAISIRHGGKGLSASMDDRFGRAEAFLVVERETGEVIEIIDNASVEASHGAGTGAANILKSADVDAVISGRFGPKAFDALRALGVETWIAPSAITAGEALRMLADGDLEQKQSSADR